MLLGFLLLPLTDIKIKQATLLNKSKSSDVFWAWHDTTATIWNALSEPKGSCDGSPKALRHSDGNGFRWHTNWCSILFPIISLYLNVNEDKEIVFISRFTVSKFIMFFITLHRTLLRQLKDITWEKQQLKKISIFIYITKHLVNKCINIYVKRLFNIHFLI